MNMNAPTRTTNRLHFEDLEPHRFEDMAYEILFRQQDWSRIDNWGRSGLDDGIDIYCEDIKGQKWFCQCKRYKTITNEQVRTIVDKIVAYNNNTQGGIVLLIIACNLSKSTNAFFERYAIEKGFEEAKVWSSTTLEASLYHRNKDLLEKYFGYSDEEQKKKRTKNYR